MVVLAEAGDAIVDTNNSGTNHERCCGDDGGGGCGG